MGLCGTALGQYSVLAHHVRLHQQPALLHDYRATGPRARRNRRRGFPRAAAGPEHAQKPGAAGGGHRAIQDLETKKADLPTEQAEYEQAYRDSSYHVRLDQAVPGPSSLPTLSGRLDPLTQAAMLSAEQARQNSSDIQLQNQLFYAALTNDGTMLDRASLRNAQEAGKTRALNEMREVINNRQTLRAAQRNEAARKQYDQEKIDQARNNIPQQ